MSTNRKVDLLSMTDAEIKNELQAMHHGFLMDFRLKMYRNMSTRFTGWRHQREVMRRDMGPIGAVRLAVMFSLNYYD